MKLSLPNAVTTRAARTALVAQKNSPRILFVTGIALFGGSIVAACQGTLNLEKTLDEIQKQRNDVRDHIEDYPERYSDRQISRLHAYVTAKGVAKIAKLYLPSIALGVAAVGCLTVSHNQLTRRNAGLSAALAATERALDAYRNRVREAYGDDKELELWRGEKTESVPVLDDEGRETKSKTKIKVGGGYSPYSRIWGRDTTFEWDPRPEYNLAKLRSVQEYCTIKLNHYGHLFLNEVYAELGLDHTTAGSQVGWMASKYGGKDGFVDFGVLAPGEEVRWLDFVQGREDHIMLDFNVDGEIWRKIDEYRDRTR
jgi:Family of unknown function (DUF6353)